MIVVVVVMAMRHVAPRNSPTILFRLGPSAGRTTTTDGGGVFGAAASSSFIDDHLYFIQLGEETPGWTFHNHNSSKATNLPPSNIIRKSYRVTTVQYLPLTVRLTHARVIAHQDRYVTEKK